MDYQKLPLFIHDYPQDAVINPDHESLNYKLPKKLIYAFVTKENIDKFLESCENVISSSTHFNEESKIFEAAIDVGKL